MGSPIFFWQKRPGKNERLFFFCKLRTMADARDASGAQLPDEQRLTGLGRLLRAASLDELPQLWNVLKGDMSLVGPRAPLPEEVREYTRWQRRRLSVRPGITCLWQVSGRNEIDFHEWMKLDLHYIDNWSLLLDLKILLRTFPVVLLGKGAR
jgi:lipopolysaccharide/colanic/teichoic acid biosynthesis glycosyltransferase